MAIDPVTAGLIGAGSNIVSNLIGNQGGRRAQKRADRYNRAQWERQNEYNHPSAQMARLKAAGLNPNLIYGTSPTSAVGNTGQAPASKAAPYNFDNPLQGAQLFANTKQSEAQTDNLKTQNTVLQQEAALKGVQTAKTASEAAKTQVESEVARQLKQTSIDAAREGLRKSKLQNIGEELNNTFKDESMKDRLETIMYQSHTAKETLSGQKLLNQLRKLEVDLKRLGIERGDPWYFRILGRQLGPEIQQTIKDIKQ